VTDQRVPEIWNTIAVDLAKGGKMSAACAAMRRAVGMSPGRADFRSNYGNMLRRAGRPGEGYAELDHALAIDPNFMPAVFNAGCSLMEGGHPDAAVAMIDRALATDPKNGDWRFARATALLQAHRWAEGFAEYESRLELRDFGASVPLWDGSPLEGRTLLLHAEQGLGDTLMFHRFRKLLQGNVTYIVHPPLGKLLGAAVAGESVDGDVHLPLMSLPHRMGVTSITGEPYIRPMHRMLLKKPPGTRATVGLIWKAKASWKQMTTDEYLHGMAKSMPIENLLELSVLDGVALYGLQSQSTDVADVGAQHLVTDLAMHDFADMASFMDQMDVIVSVDTGPVHLAGALGKPTVLCLHYAGAWQWGTKDRTPWYDSVRIVRQKKPGEWPMAEIVAEVERCLTTATSPS
jgi:Tfp pilus assembly protein PilF